MGFEQDKAVILIVDDVEMNVALLKQMIDKMGHTAMIAMNAEEAVAQIRKEIPDLILLDIVMPEISGYQFCEILKQDIATRDIPVIFVSAIDAAENKKKAFELGGVDFITKPYSFAEVSMRVTLQLKLYRIQKELEQSNRILNKIVSEQAEMIENEQKRLLAAIARFASLSRSIGSRGHIENLAKNSRLMAQGLNFTKKYENRISGSYIDNIEAAAGLHDIGKLMVPDSILKKPSKLSVEEKMALSKHTSAGESIIKEIYPKTDANEFMRMALEITRSHHERWDGTGYPDKLKGEDIPLSARIVSLVNFYDKLVCKRPYKEAVSKKEAAEIINSESGKRFDPEIVDLFNKVSKQMLSKE